MNTNKLLKIVSMILILGVVISITVSSYAGDFNWSTAIHKADTNTGVTELNKSASNVAGAILNVVRIVGVGISLIMLTVVAMKYMLAAPGDRADIKKHAIPFVIGAVILFAAANLLKLLADFASKNVK